eukprot:3499119-Amphidinium_carterae.2
MDESGSAQGIHVCCKVGLVNSGSLRTCLFAMKPLPQKCLQTSALARGLSGSGRPTQLAWCGFLTMYGQPRRREHDSVPAFVGRDSNLRT